MHMTANALRASLLALSLAATAAPALADDAPADYVSKVDQMIHKAVVYPRLAKMREQEGTVAFAVKIDGGGAVSDASVETSSGNTTLDNAALDAAKTAAPYPAPPGGAALVHLKVAFSLK
ncbi:MAG TPA: TonB family protein [Aliidongia sp.]|nr:TonB family protein [Aliidongia sp.]